MKKPLPGLVIMKKAMLLVSPVVLGLIGGLLAECIVCALSLVASPFAEQKDAPFLTALCIAAVCSALLLMGTAVVNLRCLSDFNHELGCKLTVLAEILICLLVFFLSWPLWESVVDKLYFLYF